MSTATVPTIERKPELRGQTAVVIGGSWGGAPPPADLTGCFVPSDRDAI